MRKRGAGWQLAVYAGWAAGKRKYVYEVVRGSKREAEARLNALFSEVQSGKRGAPTKTTLQGLADEWWETASRELSPTTRRGYRRLLDVRILPALGHRNLTRLTTQDLDRYYASLAKGTAPGGGALAPRSIRHIHAVISGMLATAVRWGWIASSPAERARLPRIEYRRVSAPEPRDVTSLLDAAAAYSPELGLFLRVAVATGGRRGELCGIRWSDINFDHRELAIVRTIASKDTDPKQLVVKEPKSHQGRLIALDDGTVDALRQMRQTLSERALECGAQYGDDAFVFASDPAGHDPWHPDAATATFRRVAARAGVAGVRLHDLRHYHGTVLADLGVPLTSVRDRLGHRDLQTTNIYAHGRRATDHVAADLVGKHIDGARVKKRALVTR
ncbi:MAG: tyrosine-type recombinase/integrase [Acidimicrobiia bacterium]